MRQPISSKVYSKQREIYSRTWWGLKSHWKGTFRVSKVEWAKETPPGACFKLRRNRYSKSCNRIILGKWYKGNWVCNLVRKAGVLWKINKGKIRCNNQRKTGSSSYSVKIWTSQSSNLSKLSKSSHASASVFSTLWKNWWLNVRARFQSLPQVQKFFQPRIKHRNK